MKRAILTRGPSTDQGTFGDLQLDGGPVMHTTELPWRDNHTGASCIPPAVYRCELVDSPSKGRVYGVLKVPGRDHILIHSANFGGDTAKGWTSELLGCIAPCTSVGVLRNQRGIGQSAGLQSKVALARLMDWAAGEPFDLEIR